MALRTRTLFFDVLLVFLCLACAFLADQFVMPRNQFVSAPFAVSVLIAAYRLAARGAIVTGIVAFGLASCSAHLDNSPVVLTLFGLLGLVLSSVLAILLGHQHRVSTALAHSAQVLAEQAHNARITLRTLIDRMPAGVLVSDPSGAISLANATAHAILGGQATGDAFGPVGGYTLLWHNGTAFPGFELPLARAIERGEQSANVEVRVRWEDGTERVILTGATPIRDEYGRVIAAVEAFQDVTERIQTEEALRASQESLARAQEVAHLGNWDHDLRTGKLHCSDEVSHIFGTVPDAFTGTVETFFPYVHPDDQERVTRAIEVCLVAPHLCGIDHRIVRPDSSVRIVHQETQLLRDVDGQPIRVLGTIQDITERKQAEEERERLLQEVQLERARVEAILNHSASAIIYVDAASEAVQANPAAVQLFGHSFLGEQGPALYLPQLRHPDERPLTR